MKLTNKQSAPWFSTPDVFGTELDLAKLTGQKVYLAFERNAGCPVCNLRTHELLKHSEFFKSNNVKVLLVYESPESVMRGHLGDAHYPFHFISDSKNLLYQLYGVERSMLKVMKALLHGLLSKVQQGNKLFNKPMKQDGHLDRIPAEFIINEQGQLVHVHYGRYVGDHIPVKDLIALVRGN